MKRILVIDDDASVRSAMTQTLVDAGYETSSASGGEEGVSIVGETPIDLVVTDIFMPDRDGVEIILELRRDYPDMGIVAVSGGGTLRMGNYLPAARKLGAQRTLEKPFSSEQLLSAVEEVPEGPAYPRSPCP
jgi:DNA-binding NtrC family response regulator